MRILLLAVLLSWSSHSVFAWGQTGHRAIGEVAEAHLSKKAKKNIEKLLGPESLAIVSTYMDEVRSDDSFDHTHAWHYVTIEEGKTYAESDKNPKGDLIEAIGRMKATLRSDTASTENKVIALKFLVHLIGDLHQPLHVGNGTDRGGNDVKVKFFWEKSNLHRVWDSGMIDGKDLSYTELAESINHPTKAEMEAWQHGTTTEWAEDMQKHHAQIYDINDPERMGYEYSYKNWPLVQHQLLQAGVRLAHVLNEIFG